MKTYFSIDTFTTKEDCDAMIEYLTTLRKTAYTEEELKKKRR